MPSSYLLANLAAIPFLAITTRYLILVRSRTNTIPRPQFALATTTTFLGILGTNVHALLGLPTYRALFGVIFGSIVAICTHATTEK